MESELETYGKFVLYNGMKESCDLSKKSADYLLNSLYSVIDKTQASYFFLKGIKDYLEFMNEDQLIENTHIPLSYLEECKQAHDLIANQENQTFLKTIQALSQKRTKLSQIDKYKNLEISKSIIFQHIKSAESHQQS